MPHKGPPTKKAKEVTYHTSTRTYKDKNLQIVLSNEVLKDNQNIHKPKKPRYSGIETRSTPKPLTDYVMSLNKDQKLAVASMGLEAMLHLNVNMMREDLAEWLLDSYNSKTSTLITGRGDVDIVPKDVHFILGLPLGGCNIKLPNRTNADSPIVQQFRRQYGGCIPAKRLRPFDFHEECRSNSSLKRQRTQGPKFKPS
ncbi:hypothetical protein QQ045_021161 [Rhodiola kirilowii]